MADPILGGLLGGALRVVPEVFTFFDKRNARKHELALGEQQAELLKLQASTHLAEIGAQGQQVLDAAGMEALVASIKAQGTPSGIKWVDAISASVRPVWTYLVLLSWFTVTKVIASVVLIQSGATLQQFSERIWVADDSAMLSTLMTFWFLDRVLRKQQVR
jgi:hypothetical protein